MGWRSKPMGDSITPDSACHRTITSIAIFRGKGTNVRFMWRIQPAEAALEARLDASPDCPAVQSSAYVSAGNSTAAAARISEDNRRSRHPVHPARGPPCEQARRRAAAGPRRCRRLSIATATATLARQGERPLTGSFRGDPERQKLAGTACLQQHQDADTRCCAELNGCSLGSPLARVDPNAPLALLNSRDRSTQ